MKISSWGITDVGLKRKQNQDTILLDPDLGLYIVADGMGGHKGGEVASAMACELIQKRFKEELDKGIDIDPQSLILSAYVDACEQIYLRSSEQDLDLKGMGTTVVLLFFYKGTVYIGNVGDSRAYLFRAPHMWPLTEDHSFVYEQLKEGIGVSDNIGKNVITRSVGFEREVLADVFEREVEPGDKYLICSDGLCGLVPDEEISRILHKIKNVDIPGECVVAAHNAGGDDNISAIVIQISE